jgi:hypothetical protein
MNKLLPSQKAHQLKVLGEAMAIVQALPENRSCTACDHLKPAQRCSKFDQDVPADFLEQGCEAFEERVPFE